MSCRYSDKASVGLKLSQQNLSKPGEHTIGKLWGNELIVTMKNYKNDFGRILEE